MRRAAWVLLVFSLPSGVEGQTAEEILDRIADSYAEQISGIDDYTVSGRSFTSYYKKYPGPDGYPIFRTKTEDTASGVSLGNMTSRFHADNMLELRGRLSGVAEHTGRADVRGIDAHVLRLTDFTAMAPLGSGDQQPPDSVLFFVDPDGWLLVRLSIHGSVPTPGQQVNVTPTIDFEDFRDIQGMKVPFLTRLTMVGAQLDLSQQQVDDAQQALEKLEQRLQDMPAAQREMMLDRLRPQLERMQQIAETGTLETVFEVESVEVNTGLPDSMFN
jgi:hypothetical protein